MPDCYFLYYTYQFYFKVLLKNLLLFGLSHFYFKIKKYFVIHTPTCMVSVSMAETKYVCLASNSGLLVILSFFHILQIMILFLCFLFWLYPNGSILILIQIYAYGDIWCGRLQFFFSLYDTAFPSLPVFRIGSYHFEVIHNKIYRKLIIN